MTFYKGIEVFEMEPNGRDGQSVSIERTTERLENPVGHDGVYDLDTERVRLEIPLLFTTREAAWDFITNWIPARNGRVGTMWVPSWRNDFVVDNVGAGPSFFDDRISTMFADGYHRHYFYAQWLNTNNTLGKWVNGWTAATPLPGNRVQMGVIFNQIPWADAVANGSLRISWLYLMRLESDEIEISWFDDGTVEVTLTFLEVPRVEYPTSPPYL